MDARLPAHIEVSSLIRAAQAQGGFGMVLNKGDRDAGTILLVFVENGAKARAWERMPSPDGTRAWHCSKRQDPEEPREFDAWVQRRAEGDSDLWVVELDGAGGERLIGIPAGAG